MEVDDTFIVTGGYDRSAPDYALNSVVRYDSKGVSEVLTSLTVRRYEHACASYLNDNGQRVSWHHCEYLGLSLCWRSSWSLVDIIIRQDFVTLLTPLN